MSSADWSVVTFTVVFALQGLGEETGYLDTADFAISRSE